MGKRHHNCCKFQESGTVKPEKSGDNTSPAGCICRQFLLVLVSLLTFSLKNASGRAGLAAQAHNPLVSCII